MNCLYEKVYFSDAEFSFLSTKLMQIDTLFHCFQELDTFSSTVKN
jgi:hypothetical protein